jgi:class 3 adenylate cyclase
LTEGKTDGQLDGERKMVTALFADIKGSTELMEDLDPEEARAIIDPALQLMIEAVRHYDGYIVQSTGDGIFALFGAPAAHEDHPQRALYAAVRMQDELRRYGSKLQLEGRTPIEIRVGVNSGEVVVRSIRTGGAHSEYTPIGHTTNLAARLQAIARTSSFVVSENTRRLTEGYFQLRALGAMRVKGIAEPLNVYEVNGLGALRTRLQRAVGRGLTRFVGREREFNALKEALELAKAGHGQIVASVGEPGVGKSRLFYEFKAISQSGCMVLEAFSVSYGKASTYLPVIDLLRNYFDISPGDDERKRREKVTGRVVALDRGLEDTLPYLFSLLGIVEGNDPTAQIDGQLKKRRTHEAIKRIVLRESLNQPLMVIFEDLHWVDRESEALLNMLADSIGTAMILLLVNYRPEYSHGWSSKTYYTQLRLDPLGRENAEEMLKSLLDGGDDLVPVRRLIIEKTEGTPFFMEETVQMLYDQGALVRNGSTKLVRPLAELKIPPTVQAILASRIDRLPVDEKELLQTLAVIGREFALSLVRKVTNRSDDNLSRMLNDLQMGEFIYERPAVADIEYEFKHALTQEVAYNSVLADRRRSLHERTAAAVERLYADRLDDHLSELAHHYRRSANYQKAVEYLDLAAHQAMQRWAYNEAMDYLTAGLEVLKRLPENSERTGRELGLQIALSQSMGMTRGLGRPEVGRALLRARELCELVGRPADLLTVLIGLMTHYTLQLRLRVAHELGHELLAMMQSSENLGMRGPVEGQLGMVSTLMGKFQEAREYFDRSVTSSDVLDTRKRDISLVSGHTEIGPFYEAAFYPAFRALPLWALGYSDQV